MAADPVPPTPEPPRPVASATARDDDARAFAAATERIRAAVSRVVEGKPEAVDAALTTLLAEGHLLIEDVPGVGKTVLARALAAAVDVRVQRIQFTPDLLPGDVTGVSVFSPATGSFEFTPGAVFSQLVIADEINRSSPKTQSALLEAMAEGQVTVDGRTYPLPSPFFVVATQNPLEMAGTYALPEAQRDRFMMRISMGYPDAEAEVRMLRDRETSNPLDAVTPVVDADELGRLIAWARTVYVSPAIERYAVALAGATRTHPAIRLGASPRASLQLVRAAKVHAALRGRAYVLPDDLTALLPAVFAHRLLAARGPAHAEAPVLAALHEIARTTPAPAAA